MKRFCPACGIESEWEKIVRNENFVVRGEDIIVEAEYYHCGECQAEFEDIHADNDPYESAYREYRNRKGMVQPEQILEFRNRYNLTQKELSTILGFGDVTLSRYENGALQDEAHDKLLHLVMDPINLIHLLQRKKGLLTNEKHDKMILSLKKEILEKSIFQRIFINDTPDIYSGNKQFDLSKVINVIKFFTHDKEVYKSKLLKLLFYSDFKFYKQYHSSITGLQYAHLPYGPVPNNYELLIGAILGSDPSINMVIQPIGNYIGELIISSEPYDQSAFSRPEIEVLMMIYTYFLNYTAKQIEDYSHEERGYKETENSKLITYEFANELRVGDF